MKKLLLATLLLFASHAFAECPAWLNHDMQKLRSTESVNLCELSKDKVVLIVNTASKCGFTPQFEGLEMLYQKYKKQGFTIIGFPSDSFFQELDDEEAIAEVCFVNYGVSFTMLESTSVRGKNANPIFQHLNKALGKPSWNFNKYLLDRHGKAIEKFGSRTKPQDEALSQAIEKLLAEKP